MPDERDPYADLPLLPESVPVQMPNLPPRLAVTTMEQFRAASDPVRSRILGIVQNQPATAKQIAQRLGATPGAIGHHLHILEEVGLAQVIARRMARGVVAKYYTRTARIFDYHLSKELTGATTIDLDILRQAWSELAESPGREQDDSNQTVGFPHARLSAKRAQRYRKRFMKLLDDLVNEPVDPEGQVYGICVALFLAPAYLQSVPDATTD